MSHLTDAAGLLAGLGRGIGIELTLDERDEAAIELPSGMTIVFAANAQSPMLLMEARAGHVLAAETGLPLIEVLAINRRPEIGTAALAAVEHSREVVLRQSVHVTGLHNQDFVNVVDNFVRAAEFAFGALDGLSPPRQDAGRHHFGNDEIIMRG